MKLVFSIPKYISLDTVEWTCTVSSHEFTTKHQTDISAIHSTQLIVGGVNITLTTTSSIWYDVINHAELLTISIMIMTEYSKCHVYVCAK